MRLLLMLALMFTGCAKVGDTRVYKECTSEIIIPIYSGNGTTYVPSCLKYADPVIQAYDGDNWIIGPYNLNEDNK